jgi:hypothetical protein
MRQITSGDAYVGDRLVACFELARTFESRPRNIGTGHRLVLRDFGGERQATIEFPKIHCPEFRSKLQRMIDAQVSIDERRRLRDQGLAGIAVVLRYDDGSLLEGSVGPPSFAFQPAEGATFPVGLAA